MNQDTIPDTLLELFTMGDFSYSYINYNGPEMDNVEAMAYFKEKLGLVPDRLIENLFILEIDDGTQLFISCSEKLKLAIVDSGGLGDFFSHGFDVQILTFKSKEELMSYIHGK